MSFSSCRERGTVSCPSSMKQTFLHERKNSPGKLCATTMQIDQRQIATILGRRRRRAGGCCRCCSFHFHDQCSNHSVPGRKFCWGTGRPRTFELRCGVLAMYSRLMICLDCLFSLSKVLSRVKRKTVIQ